MSTNTQNLNKLRELRLNAMATAYELQQEQAKLQHLAFDDPDGQVKFPHPWPPQIPPGRTLGL